MALKDAILARLRKKDKAAESAPPGDQSAAQLSEIPSSPRPQWDMATIRKKAESLLSQGVRDSGLICVKTSFRSFWLQRDGETLTLLPPDFTPPSLGPREGVWVFRENDQRVWAKNKREASGRAFSLTGKKIDPLPGGKKGFWHIRGGSPDTLTYNEISGLTILDANLPKIREPHGLLAVFRASNLDDLLLFFWVLDGTGTTPNHAIVRAGVSPDELSLAVNALSMEASLDPSSIHVVEVGPWLANYSGRAPYWRTGGRLDIKHFLDDRTVKVVTIIAASSMLAGNAGLFGYNAWIALQIDKARQASSQLRSDIARMDGEIKSMVSAHAGHLAASRTCDWSSLFSSAAEVWQDGLTVSGAADMQSSSLEVGVMSGMPNNADDPWLRSLMNDIRAPEGWELSGRTIAPDGSSYVIRFEKRHGN
jgi:hypothetical protein